MPFRAGNPFQFGNDAVGIGVVKIAIDDREAVGAVVDVEHVAVTD
jgi:hypothetical protein